MILLGRDAEPTQGEVVGFLLRELPGPVERIETHAAVVLLTGDRAYKLKRAVRYSFLDFSTLARREAALRAELRLNRRTAPGHYLRVLAVTRTADGALELDGAGEPVEWLLEMRRFPGGALLSELADRGRLDDRTIDRLAAIVAEFHGRAEPRPDRGGAAGIAHVVAENAVNLTDLAAEIDAGESLDDVLTGCRDRAAALAPLLDRRAAEGRVRHCHGDLHLGNVVLVDGEPLLFDCVEWDDAYACIDVLYDLAFLVMDLMDRALAAGAQRLLQGWNERTLDDAGLAALPLFGATRALVRAKVVAYRARDVPDPGDRAVLRARARRYVELARRFLAPPAPVLVAIGGRSGTGKSFVAARLAPELGALPGAIVLRSDVIRKRQHGRRLDERLGAHGYEPAAAERVYTEIAERAAVLLRAGHSVIADAVFGEPAWRAGVEAAAETSGAALRRVWLTAPEDVLLSRVRARTGDASDADVGVVLAQRGLDRPPPHWSVVESRNPDELIRDVRALVSPSGAPGPLPRDASA